jgi:hypothetical protein
MCIYIGSPHATTGPLPRLRIRGLPESRTGAERDLLGDSWTGEKGSWFANMVGQRLDVDEIQLQEVTLISQEATLEHNQLHSKCEWNEKMEVDPDRLLRGIHPLFMRGTCAHYVEWLYECAGIDIVVQEHVRDVKEPDRLHPGAQIHAFWTGSYPLDCPWDDRLRRYPDCLFGVPNQER